MPLASQPVNIRARIEAVQEKAGFIPNIFLALAQGSDAFQAFFAYHDALMDRPGNLSIAGRKTRSLPTCTPPIPAADSERSAGMALTSTIGANDASFGRGRQGALPSFGRAKFTPGYLTKVEAGTDVLSTLVKYPGG